MKILIELIFFFKIPLPKRVLGIALKLGGGNTIYRPMDLQMNAVIWESNECDGFKKNACGTSAEVSQLKILVGWVKSVYFAKEFVNGRLRSNSKIREIGRASFSCFKENKYILTRNRVRFGNCPLTWNCNNYALYYLVGVTWVLMLDTRLLVL